MGSVWTIERVKDPQLVKPDWSPANPIALEGATARQITSVLTNTGCVTASGVGAWGGTAMRTHRRMSCSVPGGAGTGSVRWARSPP